MTKNPLLLIGLVLLLRQQSTRSFPALSALEIEALIDQVHTMIHTMEKVNAFAKSDLMTSLPDMKKMLEAVEKIPL